MNDVVLSSTSVLSSLVYETEGRNINAFTKDKTSSDIDNINSNVEKSNINGKLTKEGIEKVIKNANDKICELDNDKRIEYSYHNRTKTFLVKFVDIKTGEIIKEIPPEKLLDIAADRWEMFGLIVDKKC